uniref:Protein kinase domain-containing protein n=1 Tax=Chenopodium quinoa TaxID=63459 RepID=A0A803KZJ5_CHEQI
MEQFRQVGEVLGSLKALMVFQHHIQINKRQCCFLLDAFTLAYETVADEMRSNLRFEEKHKKWKVLEQPFKELYKILREAEAYVRNCFESKNWWAKAITLYQNRDSIEFHIHNLLCCIPIVIEAIETAGELSSWDDNQINKRRLVWSRKYQNEWNDPKLFRWKFGKQYVVTEEICNRIDEVWKEDRWILLDKIQQKRIPESPGSTKYGQQLMNLLLKNLDEAESSNGKLLPCSVLLNSKDYQVRKRLGNGGEYKEIFWLGETFVFRHIKGDIEPLIPELSQLLSLSHPNILQFLCGFMDDEKKECFLVTEQMSRNLSIHVKEFYGPRKRIPLALPVALDIMLQIARGMEYLHSKKIYHGDLKPSNILAEVRNISSEGFIHVKVTRFGLSSVTRHSQNKSNPSEELSFIWHAPEVLTEQEESKGATDDAKYTEKSDVYSFGMICFELLTGKVPFEDSHLQGEKMSRNIRVGERPLFPHHCPKYMTNFIKRCWHTDPDQRPTFSSICRILRYIKRFLMMNSDYSHPDTPVPYIDYYDVESGFLKKFSSWMSNEPYPVSEIPFQMFAFRVLEREKCISIIKDASESGSEAASMSGDDHATAADDPLLSITERKNPIPDDNTKRRLSLNSRLTDSKANKFPGTQKGQSLRPPQLLHCSCSMQFTPDNHMLLANSRIRRKSGHASDSEL